MSEIAVNELPDRLRQLAVKARDAQARGSHDVVIEYAATILVDFPGCLAVRKLHHEAQRARGFDGPSVAQRAKGVFAGIRSRFGSRKSSESSAPLNQADTVIAADPWSQEGWRRLAVAAASADLRETAVFAWKNLVVLAPRDRVAGLGLVRALLEMDRYAEAVTAVEALLKRDPKDGEALALLRRASIDHTVEKGKWDSDGSFREKLRD
ncbi:MAG: hypothetical protein HOH58_11115 [Opitutaceae bacterium]|jgi:hypothetical protein|nr:hypothetical protein [Opitutaceae bacterium]